MLARTTVKRSNFFTMDEVFGELQKLSVAEEHCYEALYARRRIAGSIGVVALSAADMAPLYARVRRRDGGRPPRARWPTSSPRTAAGSASWRTTTTPRAATSCSSACARSSRYKEYDLRDLLKRLGIVNGGGHEGAIGFRVPRGEIGDFDAYLERLLASIEGALGK